MTSMQMQQYAEEVSTLALRVQSFGHRHRFISEREVLEIAAIDQPILRNLRITLGYHDIVRGMAELLGSRNITWPGFACWASRTAGCFIRGDYIPQSVQRYLKKLKLFHSGLHTVHRILTGMRGEAPPAHSLLGNIVERVSREITKNVSWGNLMVFEDIAPIFARMLERFRDARSHDQDAINRFVGEFKPGLVRDGGQDLLAAAFANYYQAIFERDPKKKAELILLANNQVGYHEQSRLQLPIVQSLNAPIADLITKEAHQRAHELTSRHLHRWVDRQIDRILKPFSAWLQEEWQSIVTSWFMHLQLPDDSSRPDKIVTDDSCIKVGEDAPPSSEHFIFPPELAKLDNTELKALLYDLDNTPDSTAGSGANNWANLADRMNYLVDLFRTRQQDTLLYRQPFTDEQLSFIRDDQIPDGPL